MRFTIEHATHYRFSQAVELHPHRLMLRPRDGHHLRLVEATLTLSPNASVLWSFDVFGNSIGTAAFSGFADSVSIVSSLTLERFPAHPQSLAIDGRHASFPVVYTPEERRDLATLLLLDDERGVEALETWLEERGLKQADDALELAIRLMGAVHGYFRYEARYAEGTMRPVDSLASGSGTCRDYAFFMMEAARILGFAARFATGYLYSPALDPDTEDGVANVGAAATHAWAELYISGIGWVDFDPTNNLTGAADLIKVASVRKPSQAIPVSGSFTGPTGAGSPPEVSVSVTRAPAFEEAY